jgi:hypothetical protein
MIDRFRARVHVALPIHNSLNSGPCLSRTGAGVAALGSSYCPSELLRLADPSSPLGSLQSLDRRVAASAQRRVDPFDHEVMNLDLLLEGDLA